MNLQSFDLNLLLAFEALMIERNVTRAAKRIGLSQPAMSNALSRLRRTFDDPLLARSPEGMAPTAAAHALIGPVRAALAQLRGALEEKPAFDPAASKRTFHLSTSDHVEVTLIPPLVAKLLGHAPRVSLRLTRPRTLFQPPAAQSFADSIDVAIGFFPDVAALDASIHSEVLWEEKSVVLARKAHPRIKGKLTLKQFAAEQHAAVFYKTEGQGFIDSLLEQKGLTRRAAIIVPHFASVPFLVAASELIATVPERTADHFATQLKLQVFPAPLAIPPFRMTMLWHERMEADPAHSWLRGLIVETALGARASRPQS
ncbi:MAG TPA: LysR family transcriptional regulator [Blastocatellia bacterium]|nr:LysR family transcriptional regulator [Blastocatellia bacterium]